MQKGDVALRELQDELAAMAVPYTVERFLSSGSYGAVCAGLDQLAAIPVAVKRVYNTVSDDKTVNILSDTFLARRVIREVKLLCHFQHPHILGLRDLMGHMQYPSASGGGGGGAVVGKHKLYLVTELMKTDLAQVLQDRRIVLTPEHIQHFMYSMLLGIRALHIAGVVHRDLHPGNILLSEANELKICDFNLAREDTPDDDKTHYVTHRWYRAPELVMQHRGFTKMVDIWSAGCIMAELYNRKALFRGSTFYNQLNRIVEVVGTPADADVAAFASPSAREYLRNSLGGIAPVPWGRVVPNAASNPAALDLISQMLQFSPSNRITAEAALQHPFFTGLYDEMDLHENLPAAFHFNEAAASIEELHGMLHEETERFQRLRDARQAEATAAASDDAAPASRPAAVPGGGEGALGQQHFPRTASSVSFTDGW